METLYGKPYLMNGNITLRVLHRYQTDVRNSIITGGPSASIRLRTLPVKLIELLEPIKLPKPRPLISLLHTR
jgi:hypothetical protein